MYYSVMKNPILKLILVLSIFANGIFAYMFVQNGNGTAISDTGTSTHTTPTQEPVVYESGKSYPFIRVIDGDTIVVAFDDKQQYVRLIGMNSPEPHDPAGPECYAKEATDHLREITQTGLVVLHFDESQGMHDSYGRLLAYVELTDGTDLGMKMIEDGYAHEYEYKSSYARQMLYKESEKVAIEEERGLWANDICN
jgi:micrococcal nuclease